MSQTDKESLVALEHLMEEFFTHSTSNGRKHDIETQLNSFSSQRDCWKLCVYFLTHTSSQYVSMYSLSTIESVINRQWVALEWEHRVQLKSALYNYLMEQGPTAPHFLRNKLAKLIVDIARLDWPHFFPEFLTNIIQLLQSNDGQLLGLVMLHITSEEFMSSRPDLSSYRKDELTKLLQQNIPQIFQILCTILQNLGIKPRHAATATPPPSPTQPGAAPVLTRELINASFRPDNKFVTRECLGTIQHLFTWADLAAVPLPLIKNIFYFTNISTYAQDDDDMCVLAMSALNELFYRKCSPPGTQNLFTQLYHHTVQLLRDIVCPNSCRIETLGNDFVDKLSELLALLVEQHLWRLEAEPGFSALDFLSLLYQLTIQLPSLRCYLRCLTVWVAFIKQLKPQNTHKYSEALLGLVSVVLNKMQFTYNLSQLEEMDNEPSDEQSETEWEVFLNTSVEVIAMVAEYAPVDTFNEVLLKWRAANDVYCLLENAIDDRSCALKIEPSENVRLHCILRDLSSLTQTLARLSSLFTDQDNDYYNSSAPIIDSLVNSLIKSALVAANGSFHLLKSRLNADFVEVHSQILAALKTWMPWIPLNNEIMSQHLKQLLAVTLPLLRGGVQYPGKVTHSAAHLLLSLSNVVFPPSLVILPTVVEYIHIAPAMKYNGTHTREVVNNAVCNILIRPWGELSQADGTHRNALINTFFDGLTRDFRELGPHSSEGKVREVISHTLPLLSHIIEFAKDFPSQSKKLLYMGIKTSIDTALQVFPTYSSIPDVSDHILVLFVNVLSVLQQQLGVECIKHAVEVFLDVAVSQQQSKNLSGLDKLLQILQIVVESPGSAYKGFLPGILQLCMQHVYPLAISQASEHPDVIIALLTLLHSILVHRWQYFYISQVRLGHSPGCSESDLGPDSPQQPAQLLAVLQVFGQALMQPDINTFRTSLAALENLQAKWKLYNKMLFRQQLLHQFLTVLWHTLLDRSHTLLTDDILLAIYNMAAVNFQVFFNTFLTEFLDSVNGLTSTQRDSLKQSFNHETDMPTFIQNFQRFINDLRCYRICNVSIPLGSVIL
ncbi:exportin-6 isoform X1 [Photinus pyralis]|nr:exportin-6 isoform X1 [Photinus pyralis]